MTTIEVLPNGITLLLEKLPHLRSVAVGITTKVGSVYESPQDSGLSHFLEHLVFKGTKTRDALCIAETMDAVGGRLNAHTGKESTTYYAVVLDEHVDIAVDILSDIFLNPKLDQQDIEMEKTVVQEEIKLYEDTPDELIHDLALQDIWPAHALGQSILGSQINVSKFTREQLVGFRNRLYDPKNTIISLAGNIDIPKIIKLIDQTFSKMTGNCQEVEVQPLQFHPGLNIHAKASEQNHICWTCPGLSYNDPKRYVLAILNNVLGATMSSRLFQEVREKRGLAYAVYSYPTMQQQGGCFSAYAGAASKVTEDVVQIIINEVNKLKTDKISENEFQKARENLKGNLVLGLESSSSRMSWNTKSQLYYNRIVTLDETFSEINSVTIAQVQDLACELFNDDKQALTIIGKIDKEQKKHLAELISLA